MTESDVRAVADRLRAMPRDELTPFERAMLEDNERANRDLQQVLDKIRQLDNMRAQYVTIADYTMLKAVEQFSARQESSATVEAVAVEAADNPAKDSL